MKGRLVVSIEPAEAIRLARILQDRDEGEALAFLQEHCKEELRRFLEGS
jgi:hypothetical protein